MKRWILSVTFLLITAAANAQCAMCRATLENNLSDGDLEVGASINVGILYLFVTPYIALGLLAFFWFKHSRANAKN